MHRYTLDLFPSQSDTCNSDTDPIEQTHPIACAWPIHPLPTGELVRELLYATHSTLACSAATPWTCNDVSVCFVFVRASIAYLFARFVEWELGTKVRDHHVTLVHYGAMSSSTLLAQNAVYFLSRDDSPHIGATLHRFLFLIRPHTWEYHLARKSARSLSLNAVCRSDANCVPLHQASSNHLVPHADA